jgi:small GTP-binding protein
MKVYDAQSIRNVALVGHSGAGKTQLLSTLLFDAGAVNRLGRVDDGTTVTDYDEEEIARKHTLSASLAYAEWNKTKINFIDTPGMANFLSEARAALRVSDAALVVVDSVAGVEVSTEKVWAVAEELEVPRLVVLNRLDRERASMERSLESLRSVFGRTVIPIQLPIGEEKSLRGIVDLVGMKAWTFATDGSGKPTESAIPGDMADAATAARDALIEMVAEADDALMEKFFDAGTLTQEELVGGLKRGFAAGRVYPVVCTSAIANVGVQPLLDAVITYVPSPAEGPIKVGEDARIAASDTGPIAAFVWKTVADPFAGRITLFRVISGTLKADSTVHNATRETSERLGHLVLLQGKTQTNVPEIKAGDVGAVAKLKETQTSDMLADKGFSQRMSPIKFPEPVISYAIEPKSRADEAVRRRGQPEAAPHSVSRDDHVAHRGARPAQEADGRPWPVRRLQGKVRAAAARERLRVRRRHLWRFDPPAVHPGGREGAAGRADARLPRRISNGRFSRHGVRRLVSPGRLERAVLQDGGIAGVQGRHVTRAAHAARARDGRRGPRTERICRRSDGGLERPARPDWRHGHTRPIHDHPRQSADVRDVDLRTAPHLRNRRPRVLSHGVLPLRGGAVTPARQDHRGCEGRAWTGGGRRGIEMLIVDC